ncbi:MAG: tetratricopeptide repeat protein [Gemmatimonadales bacterium]
MLVRLKLTHAAAVLAMLAVPALAESQDGGRSRVLVPYFEPREGAERNFGEQATEDLREMMRTLPFHVAVTEDEMEDMADRFNVDVEDVNCLTGIQLATQVNIPVIICGNYTQDAERNFTLNASIRTVQSNDEFVLPPVTVPRNGREQAAEHVIQQFERYNTVIRSAQICQDYVASQQWESALRNCDESLAINPNALTTRFLRARILFELGRQQEALEDFDRVLQLDPLNEVALQTAGVLATQLGEDERGRDYFRRYLEVNPGNAAIRLRIASEMAEAGNPAGAMEFIEPGLEVEPENQDLLTLFGTFAFMGAIEAQTEASGTVTPEAAGYYRQAIDTFLKLYELQGDEMTLDALRNIVLAYMQLEDYPAAISMAERILQNHPDDAQLQSLYTDALQRSGRQADAYVALDRLIELQPDNESAYLRKATWLIAERRLEDAAAALRPTATDQAKADNAASLIFNEAYTNGFQKNDWAYSIRGMMLAKNLPNISTNMREQLNFWHAYSVFQRTRGIMPTEEQPTLAQAREAQPGFQEAKTLFGQAGGYPARAGVDMATLMSGVDQYLEICDIIIRRGY